MLRIAHISDLHFRTDTMKEDEVSLLQNLAASYLGKKFEFKVEAGGHDTAKLDLLRACLIGLKPNVIVVTGDLSNFGDRASLEMAVQYLKDLQKACNSQRVLCVPGNHDCLIEREADLEHNQGPIKHLMLWVARQLSRIVDVIHGEANKQFPPEYWEIGGRALLLQNYRDIVEAEFGPCELGSPVLINAKWGNVALFPFNSVNDPGLMANKGCIGIDQYIGLNNLAQNPDSWAQLAQAVRIALLHHHPISAPKARDSAAFYNWMEDGPRFLSELNSKHFHFILHGHQHEPFACTIHYGQASDPPTNIVAAGSASQGSMMELHNSFNLIDIVSPFEAVMQRYDLTSTGFTETHAESRLIPLRPIEQVRVSAPHEADNVADWSMRELVQSSGRQYLDLGDAYRYDELEFNVTLTSNQLYKARYRRKGVLLSKNGTEGPIFIITGSPGMYTADMHLKAFDHIRDQELSCEELKDSGQNRKIIRVKPLLNLAEGEEINLSLTFEWQASKMEPHDFDAVNLMGFYHPVGRLIYRVNMPWRPTQVRVQSIGQVTEDVWPWKRSYPKLENGGLWTFDFEIDQPAPLAYLIRFPAN